MEDADWERRISNAEEQYIDGGVMSWKEAQSRMLAIRTAAMVGFDIRRAYQD